jgi:hypothetical protein
MRIALYKILSRYRLSVVPGSDIGVHIESTMLAPTNGLPMRIHPPDKEFASSPITGRIHELVEFAAAPPVVEAEQEPVLDDDRTSMLLRKPR